MGKLPRKFEEKLLTRLKEEAASQAELPPQNLGRLTPYFKSASTYFKYSPWRVMAPASLLLAVISMIVFGGLLIKVVSILQRGF